MSYIVNGKNPFQDLILVKEIWNNLRVLCNKMGERYAGTEGGESSHLYF